MAYFLLQAEMIVFLCCKVWVSSLSWIGVDLGQISLLQSIRQSVSQGSIHLKGSMDLAVFIVSTGLNTLIYLIAFWKAAS